MPNLEHTTAWSEILRLRDTLPLRELAERFGTTPGAISAALSRTGTVRVASSHDDEDLPPEAGAPEEPEPDDEDDSVMPQVRQGSKDLQIAQHAGLLGNLPDAEVARRAGVSIRTIASFRARHGIAGYRGPRRTSRERVREPEPAAPAAPRPAASPEVAGKRAWQVLWRDGATERRGVLLASDLVSAAATARDTVNGEIVGLMLVGTFL